MKKEETVDYHVKVAWHAITRMYNQGGVNTGITASTGFVLLNIDLDEGTAATKIAPLLGMEARSLTRMLKNLEESGLIYREQDTNDKRSVKIILTEEGKRKRAVAKKAVLYFNNQVREKVSDEKLQGFFDVMQVIDQVIDENKNIDGLVVSGNRKKVSVKSFSILPPFLSEIVIEQNSTNAEKLLLRLVGYLTNIRESKSDQPISDFFENFYDLHIFLWNAHTKKFECVVNISPIMIGSQESQRSHILHGKIILDNSSPVSNKSLPKCLQQMPMGERLRRRCKIYPIWMMKGLLGDLANLQSMFKEPPKEVRKIKLNIKRLQTA